MSNKRKAYCGSKAVSSSTGNCNPFVLKNLPLLIKQKKSMKDLYSLILQCGLQGNLIKTHFLAWMELTSFIVATRGCVFGFC